MQSALHIEYHCSTGIVVPGRDADKWVLQTVLDSELSTFVLQEVCLGRLLRHFRGPPIVDPHEGGP